MAPASPPQPARSGVDAEVSQRHLSFVESGRASPSREMVLRLTERLDLPLRDRNALLLAAGYAPIFPERPLDDPAMGRALDAIRRLLKGHEPYPALAVDRLWRMVAANAAVAPLLAGVADAACWPRPSTCCGSAFIRTASRPGS